MPVPRYHAERAEAAILKTIRWRLLKGRPSSQTSAFEHAPGADVGPW